jgi:hypothetical protein
MCRPQRVGVFGHRGVGKTTFLTMLYREAVGGRLPELRLAAADARTAEYLADKVLQLEAGHPLPATLGETELHFHLYYRGARLDLFFKDYQGEHVALGRQGSIRDFLRDCDAVWLCLDVPLATGSAARLQAQQEVEQLVEDYLAAEPEGNLHRPTALVLTKADLLPAIRAALEALPPPLESKSPTTVIAELKNSEPSLLLVPVENVAERAFAMTKHALRLHSPQHAVFAVSSLGGPISEGEGPFTPRPSGLDGPLTWLAIALQHQDEARLRRIWQEAPYNLALLGRALDCFRRRYPDAPLARELAVKLRALFRRRRLHRGLTGLAAAVAFLIGLLAYDVLGAWRAQRFATDNSDSPSAVLDYLRSYRAWHPTRHWFRASAARAEQDQLHALDEKVRDGERAGALVEVRRLADDPDTDADKAWHLFRAFREKFPEPDTDAEATRTALRGKRLAAVRHKAEDADADTETVWQLFRSFSNDFPEQDIDADLQQFKKALEARRNAARERKAAEVYAAIQREEAAGNLGALIEKVDGFLSTYAGTAAAVKAASRRAEYVRQRDEALRRQQEQVLEAARSYSAKNPLEFMSRIKEYQKYLSTYPGGTFEKDARDAIAAIEVDWDRYDFRQVRDHYQEHAGDVKELATRCRYYMAAHEKGRFAESARSLLRWTEQVTEARDYKVVLKSGSFDPKSVGWLSRGLYLSVELEVAGARYGPSTISSRTCTPDWDYEFPRRVRWKLGDKVRIIVTDHYYWNRVILDYSTPDDALVGMMNLSGDVAVGVHRLTFESDFNMPVLPKIE